MKNICVYCGSNPGKRPTYLESARLLATELVNRGIGLVYGGANVGLMGEIANTVLTKGGKVTGVMPQALIEKEVYHKNLTEFKIVSSMHERKAVMTEISDGFIALPGGLGTIEELFEVLTWAQLGFHKKPCGLLNIEGYYNHISAFLDIAVNEMFVKEAHRNMLLVDGNPKLLLDQMATYKAPLVDKWLNRNQT